MGHAFLGMPCHKTGGIAIRAFAAALAEQAVGGQVSVSTIRRLCDVLSQWQGPLAGHYANAEHGCVTQFTVEQEARHRANYLGRVVVKTFSHLLGEPESGISRDHLTPFLSAVQIILGEDTHTELQAKCAEIIEELPQKNRLTPWDEFFSHPQTALILEQVLVSIAKTFQRFETRKDWFLIVMNSTPNSKSIGSTALVAKSGPQIKQTAEFGEAHLMRLLSALFAGMHPASMTEQAKTDFQSRWGTSVEDLFGPLFVEISKRVKR